MKLTEPNSNIDNDNDFLMWLQDCAEKALLKAYSSQQDKINRLESLLRESRDELIDLDRSYDGIYIDELLFKINLELGDKK